MASARKIFVCALVIFQPHVSLAAQLVCLAVSRISDVKNGSVEEYFNLLWPWIRSCHINDLYKNATGAYPYHELFRLLRQRGYDRVTLCEVGRSVPDEAAGTEFLRYYKALWRELNRE